jgi:bilin biosynthesis protein
MDLIARLIEQLASDDEVVRVQAGELLLQMGSAAVRPLIDALQNPRQPARPMIAATLGQLGDKRAVEPLIAALRDPDKAVRYQAALALAKLKDRRAIRPLLHALFDEMPPVGTDSLTGEPLFVRAAAAQALGELRATEAVPALKVLLRDEERSVRLAALQALIRIGTTEALQAVGDALMEEQGDLPCWESLLRRLMRLPNPEARTILERLTQHPEPQVASLAIRFSQEMASPKSEGSPPPSPSLPSEKPTFFSRRFWRWGVAMFLGLALLMAWGGRWSRWLAAVLVVSLPIVAWVRRRPASKAPMRQEPPPLLSASRREETP